jgi:hypothetical protein
MIRKENVMSKNAIVLDDHYGDDGAVTAGMVLKDVSASRFKELEKKGLVREASAAEVKAGHKLQIETDPTKGEGNELRDDGPTIAEYVAAGYKASNYPPQGYASRSTPEEIAQAVESEKAAASPDNKKAADPKNKAS